MTCSQRYLTALFAATAAVGTSLLVFAPDLSVLDHFALCGLAGMPVLFADMAATVVRCRRDVRRMNAERLARQTAAESAVAA